MDVDLNDIISTLFDNHPKENVNEVEFSLVGYRDSGNPWNIGIAKFRQLLTGLSNHTGIKPVSEILLTANIDNNRVRINNLSEIKQFCVNNRPSIESENVIFETKSRIGSAIDLPEYGLRLRYAKEIPIDNLDERLAIVASLTDKSVKKLYRHAQRYSIISNKKLGAKGQLRVDFTSVRQGSGHDFRAAQLTGPSAIVQDRYEIELELNGITRDEFRNTKIASEIREELRFYLKYLLVTFNGGVAFEKATGVLSGLNGYLDLCAKVLGSPSVKVNNLYQKTLVDVANRFITVNIKTLNMNHIREKNGNTVLLGSGSEPVYTFTDKADGIRALLYINGDGKVFVLTRSTIRQTKYVNGQEIQGLENEAILDIYPTGLVYSDKKNTLLDGEYLRIDGKMYFLIFDVLVIEGTNVSQKDFTERIGLFKQFNINGSDSMLSVLSKQFYNYTIKDFTDFITSDKLERKMDSHQLTGLKYKLKGMSYKLDGLVFQPLSGPGSRFPLKATTWDTVFKWKPSYMATVDMELTYDGPPVSITKTWEPTTLDSVGYSVTYGVFNAVVNRKKDGKGGYMNGRTISEYMCCARMVDGVPRTEDEGEGTEPIRKGAIVECRLSTKNVGTGNMYWVPIRVRHDKSKPNDIVVYDDLLNTIINSPITLETLSVKGGGLGGSKAIVVNKINRDISNERISKEILTRIKSDDIKLLDLGCGRLKSGRAWGEVAKTKKIEILGVDQIDMSGVNVDLASYIREHKSKFKANLVHGNFNSDLVSQSDIAPYIARPHMFNVVTCTFAIHYAMATESSFRTFARNVSRNLMKGGIFIGSYMNKYNILEDMSSAKTSKLSFNKGSSLLWEIDLINRSSTEETFGVGIYVSFIELYSRNKEYLIDINDPKVIRILKEYGLELKDHAPFNSYLNDNAKSMTEAEKKWFSYHYAFVFEKINDLIDLPKIEEVAPPAPTKPAPKAVLKPKALKPKAPVVPVPVEEEKPKPIKARPRIVVQGLSKPREEPVAQVVEAVAEQVEEEAPSPPKPKLIKIKPRSLAKTT